MTIDPWMARAALILGGLLALNVLIWVLLRHRRHYAHRMRRGTSPAEILGYDDRIRFHDRNNSGGQAVAQERQAAVRLTEAPRGWLALSDADGVGAFGSTPEEANAELARLVALVRRLASGPSASPSS